MLICCNAEGVHGQKKVGKGTSTLDRLYRKDEPFLCLLLVMNIIRFKTGIEYITAR